MFTLLTAVACGMEAPAPQPPSSPAPSRADGPAKGVPLPAPPTALVSQAVKEDPAVYRSRGRRDPFRPPQAQTSLMAHLKVTGIMRGTHAYYALMELESSAGMGQIIHENDVIDSARVVRITKDSVVFEVQTKNTEGKLLTRTVQKYICCQEKSP